MADSRARADDGRTDMRGVIFLLGAGASIDADLPSVAALTAGVRDRLKTLSDFNGHAREEFPALFDAIAEYDPAVKTDYERFFEWLSLLRHGQLAPFNKMVRFALPDKLASATGELAWVIKQPIWEQLRAAHQATRYMPDYMGHLEHLLPARGPLKVFTLNYDLCVEDAATRRGIDVITGFSPNAGRWAPSRFDGSTRGINLYKLHGSLSWSLDGVLPNPRLVETCPVDWSREPEFLLGPGSKLQHDDPFVTLYAMFHRALRRAKVCVVIGYSFRDDHITAPLREASARGLTIIDVNPASLRNKLWPLQKDLAWREGGAREWCCP